MDIFVEILKVAAQLMTPFFFCVIVAEIGIKLFGLE